MRNKPGGGQLRHSAKLETRKASCIQLPTTLTTTSSSGSGTTLTYIQFMVITTTAINGYCNYLYFINDLVQLPNVKQYE